MLKQVLVHSVNSQPLFSPATTVFLLCRSHITGSSFECLTICASVRACVNFFQFISVWCSYLLEIPWIKRVKFGWIAGFVSALAVTVQPQTQKWCNYPFFFPNSSLGCPLLRHICIRFPATGVTQLHHWAVLYYQGQSESVFEFPTFFQARKWLHPFMLHNICLSSTKQHQIASFDSWRVS